VTEKDQQRTAGKSEDGDRLEHKTFKSAAFDLADLNKLYPLCGRERAATYHRYLIEAMREFEITTYHRACHFLAQIGWETGQLRYMRELDNEAGTYLRSKEYYPYYGRGAIHLTWRENYERVGRELRVDLVDEPDLAVRPQYCFRVAGQYWRDHELNYFADRRDAGFNAVMTRVLGTADHPSWGGRHALYETAKQVVPVTFDIGGGLVFQTTIFAAATHEDNELAHRAAMVCHEHKLRCTVADGDNILPANDECEPTRVGTFDFFVIGQPAKNKLPNRLHDDIGKAPNVSDYRDAVGNTAEETERKLARALREFGKREKVDADLGKEFLNLKGTA
jgi:putative chitinase